MRRRNQIRQLARTVYPHSVAMPLPASAIISAIHWEAIAKRGEAAHFSGMLGLADKRTRRRRGIWFRKGLDADQ